MVYVVTNAINGGYSVQLPGDGIYLTPDRSGAVHIVGAQGERLILLSTQGETYYFDVPSRQFAASPDAGSNPIPSATPVPFTPAPSLTPTLNSDAPHHPDDVHDYSPLNTPLRSILYQSGDEQWFRFFVPTAGTIQVHLTQLPANYDLYVYSVTRTLYTNHDGQSTNPGTADELVVINNAPADDYMVRVVGVNGAFDPVHPYQLEFDVPSSATATSTSTSTPTNTNTKQYTNPNQHVYLHPDSH